MWLQKIINHIKLHALNSCLFIQLCKEIDKGHTYILLYRKVRKLSKGRLLVTVFEFWELVQRFLLGKQSPLAAYFNDTEWITKLSGMTFNVLNKLSMSLQERITVSKSADKVVVFKAKLELWRQWVNTGISDKFQTLAEIFKETEPGPFFSQLVHHHLSQLSKELEHYFTTTKGPLN